MTKRWFIWFPRLPCERGEPSGEMETGPNLGGSAHTMSLSWKDAPTAVSATPSSFPAPSAPSAPSAPPAEDLFNDRRPRTYGSAPCRLRPSFSMGASLLVCLQCVVSVGPVSSLADMFVHGGVACSIAHNTVVVQSTILCGSRCCQTERCFGTFLFIYLFTCFVCPPSCHVVVGLEKFLAAVMYAQIRQEELVANLAPSHSFGESSPLYVRGLDVLLTTPPFLAPVARLSCSAVFSFFLGSAARLGRESHLGRTDVLCRSYVSRCRAASPWSAVVCLRKLQF